METKPRGNKAIPLHITDAGDHYSVRVRRGDVTYRARVPKSRPQALAEAMQLKARFEQLAGSPRYNPRRSLATIARSNTGIIGITETVKYRAGFPQDCFHVALFGRPTSKRVYYGRCRPRAVALAQAIQLRKQAEAGHV